MKLEDELPDLLEAASTDLNPPIDALYTASLAHGRRAVRRRKATLAACAIATCATLTVGTAWFGAPAVRQASATPAVTASQPGTGQAASPEPVHPGMLEIDTAAWSVHTQPDNTVQVTIHKPSGTEGMGTQLARLRYVLNAAGIKVNIDGMGLNPGTKPWCTPSPAPAWMPRIQNNHGDDSVITIDPSAIPPATTLRLILFLIHSDAPIGPATGLEPVTVSVGIKTGGTLACIVPTDHTD